MNENDDEMKKKNDDVVMENMPSSSPSTPKFHFISLGFALIAAISYAISNVFMKQASIFNGAEKSLAKYFIQLITMPLLMLCIGVSLLGPKEKRGLLWLTSLLSVASLTSFYYSLSYLLPSDTISLNRVSLIIITIGSWFFLKEKLNLSHIFATLITIGGKVSSFLRYLRLFKAI